MSEVNKISKKNMEKDIIKIISSYLKYWYLFVIGAAICVALAFFHLRYRVVTQYDIYAKILLNDKKGSDQSSNLESLSDFGLLKVSKNIQDEIGVLQSYDLMKITLDELGMAVGYYYEGRLNEMEVYKTQIPFHIVLNDSLSISQYGNFGSITLLNSKTYQVEVTDAEGNPQKTTYNFDEEVKTPFATFTVVLDDKNIDFKSQKPILVSFNNTEELAKIYNQKLMVQTVEKDGGGLLQITINDVIPDRGVDVVNKLIEIYERKSTEHKNILANTTLSLIDGRLELLSGELSSVEKNVESYKKTNDLTDVSSDAARFIQLAGESDRELEAIKSQIDGINALENNLAQSSGDSYELITAIGYQNASLAGLISRYNELVQTRKSMLRTAGVGNPVVIEVSKQLLDLKNAIAGNVQSIKSGLLSSKRNILNNAVSYKSKISTVPTAERALLEINRDQGLKQNLYLYLLQKREEEALSISVPFSETRIIESPRAFMAGKSKMPVYLGAILFGLFVPFLYIFSKNMLNNKIQTKEDIEEITDCFILGTIATNTEKNTVVVTENNVSPSAELFRLLRHNLKFSTQGKSEQVIMVTSGNQGEGKTFISINLAASLAVTGKKVVVLGFDLRAPKLMANVGLANTLGITDFIIDPTLDINDIIVTYPEANNLFFIGSGTLPPNPGELMLSNRIKSLIDTLKETFDYIIIDTAPIGKVSDAFSLIPYVNSTLYVVRSNYTEKAELEVFSDIVESHKLQSVMVVLNDVKLDKSSGYGYAYGGKA
ncbi:capsular exopolysaccharide synthesis family protein [Mariniflexile fucanivorans]|uniref:non-specific protein-tyrosine kinase n=2 Tax=Mariniflexile fucanivorans TaxID=264023 RepID=A0A4R1RKJ3_9FLAO|nr:capsular exopolysaccharide synthesis family protein [Mariniflexile fucanivorans]